MKDNQKLRNNINKAKHVKSLMLAAKKAGILVSVIIPEWMN